MTLNSLFKRVESSYKSRVKYPVCLLLGFALVAVAVAVGVSGCFNPSVKNGGFACSTSDVVQCPGGFFCVNGLCVDMPNAVGNGVGGNTNQPDMAQTITDDMAHAAHADLAHAPADLATAMSIVDMAQVQPDMSTKGTCAHDYCTPGAALDANCDTCVKKICAKYANCCDSSKSWSALCVSDTKTLCTPAQACP